VTRMRAVSVRIDRFHRPRTRGPQLPSSPVFTRWLRTITSGVRAPDTVHRASLIGGRGRLGGEHFVEQGDDRVRAPRGPRWYRWRDRSR
jgi:hypothetical protein